MNNFKNWLNAHQFNISIYTAFPCARSFGWTISFSFRAMPPLCCFRTPLRVPSQYCPLRISPHPPLVNLHVGLTCVGIPTLSINIKRFLCICVHRVLEKVDINSLYFINHFKHVADFIDNTSSNNYYFRQAFSCLLT